MTKRTETTFEIGRKPVIKRGSGRDTMLFRPFCRAETRVLRQDEEAALIAGLQLADGFRMD